MKLPVKSKQHVKVPLPKGVLLVNQEYCCGCMHCIFACSLAKDGTASPELARIQLAANTNYIFDNVVQPCLQCAEPQCLHYCPTHAITVDGASGTNARIIDESKCIGCQICIEKCPYTPPRVSFDKEKQKAVKCDLCGGDPQCVKFCPTGALRYYTSSDGVVSGYTDPGEI